MVRNTIHAVTCITRITMSMLTVDGTFSTAPSAGGSAMKPRKLEMPVVYSILAAVPFSQSERERHEQNVSPCSPWWNTFILHALPPPLTAQRGVALVELWRCTGFQV